jgi:hypothetical protein
MITCWRHLRSYDLRAKDSHAFEEIERLAAHPRRRGPARDQCLRLLYEEITASSLVRIDIEGSIFWKPETEYGINMSGSTGPPAPRAETSAEPRPPSAPRRQIRRA